MQRNLVVQKLEYSGSHSTFLDMDITINNGKISTKLEKHSFSFFIVYMPNFPSNIRSSVFYGTIMSEILDIAR